MFDEKTTKAIREAVIDENLRRRLTQEQRILLLLRDGQWHSARELALKVTHRFSSPLKTLADKGIQHEVKRDPDSDGNHYIYRLRLDDPQDTLFNL